MKYTSEDVAWLLREWIGTASGGGEYMTWRRLVSRYHGRSNLAWLWGLVHAAAEDGYLIANFETGTTPDPDSRVTWDHWTLTDKGQMLVGGGPQI